MPGSDALAWAGLAALLLFHSQMKLVHGLGWFAGWSKWLRRLAKYNGLYADRRRVQIVVTVAVALIVAAIFLYGMLWIWDVIRRYRVAIGFASVAAGFALIRFISLHEVDAWNAAFPWASPLVEITTASGISAVAIARLHQLGEFEILMGSD